MRTEVNFIFQADAQRIFNHFTRLLGIRIIFFTADGNEVTTGAHQSNCRYCQMLRKDLGCKLTCLKMDREKQLQAYAEKRLVSYICHGGMVEATLPVFVVNKLAGYIMIGQFRTTDNCPKKYRDLWKLMHKNDRLYEAFLEAPYYSEQKVDDILGMFEIIVDTIVTKHLISTKTSKAIEKLISYIDQNPHVNLTLPQAASMMHRSRSSISHEFKKATGMNFKKYLILKKLEAAENLMKANPQLKIHEIATQVGYTDPYLFSRIYKTHRNHPPNLFKTLQNRRNKSSRPKAIIV